MGPKYEFTDETLNWNDCILHRIRRLSDGKLGGWIESEDNLSQEGNCWVDGDAKVYENARVYGNAKVSDEAQVYGKAKVCDDTAVYDNARVYDNAEVYGDASVNDSARVYGNARIKGWIYGNAEVYDEAEVYGYANVYDNAEVYGNAKVYDYAAVYGEAEVYGTAWVHGNAHIYGNMQIDYGTYFDGYYCGDYDEDYDEDDSSNNELKEIVQDFIYKVDDSSKLTAQTGYDSIDDFFNDPMTNDLYLDTLTIYTVDTKEPLIKLQKVEVEDETEFKFIVEITNEDGDDFRFRSIIKSQEHLNQLIQRTVEALKQYPEFNRYTDDLSNCL